MSQLSVTFKAEVLVELCPARRVTGFDCFWGLSWASGRFVEQAEDSPFQHVRVRGSQLANLGMVVIWHERQAGSGHGERKFESPSAAVH